jgi:hypothetical protein
LHQAATKSQDILDRLHAACIVRGK